MAWNIIYAPPQVNTLITAIRGALGLSSSPPTVSNSGSSASIRPNSAAVSFAGQQAQVSQQSGSTAFDFYIAPNGDDNNTGSLSSPWSITAFNSKMSTYSGKRIGIIGDIAGVQTPITHGTIGGTQTTLLSILNSSANQPAINVNGGTAAASTIVSSCDSTGTSSPRWAIIDFSPSGVSSITSGAPAMGQSSESSTQVPKPGFLTFDGLTVRNFGFAAIAFRNDGGSIITNCVVQNCEVYNGGNVSSSNNPGALKFSNTSGSIVNNCKVHDLQTISGGSDPLWGNSAVMTYGTSGKAVNLIITNSTFYNCTSVLTKDSNQDINMSYCYCDSGVFGSGAFGDLNAGIPAGLCPATGVTSSIHHNIMLRGPGMHAQDGNTTNGTVKVFNNTIYGASSGGPGLAAIYMGGQAAVGATIQFFNNLVYSTNGYNAGTSSASLSVDLNQGWSINNATFNNNVYGNGMTFGVQNDVVLGSFAAWKTAANVDSTSVVLGSGTSPFTGTPTAQTPSSFATNSNAVIGSITCGALDGSGSIGCNF